MKSNFPGYIHIYTLCPKYLQIYVNSIHGLEEAVYYYMHIQYIAEILVKEGQTFPEK